MQSSLASVPEWLQMLSRHCDLQQMLVALVGNKTDMADLRQIDPSGLPPSPPLFPSSLPSSTLPLLGIVQVPLWLRPVRVVLLAKDAGLPPSPSSPLPLQLFLYNLHFINITHSAAAALIHIRLFYYIYTFEMIGLAEL